MLFAFWCWQRPKPFVDSDLIPDRMQPPLEDNAFFTLTKATNELFWPERLWDTLDNLCNDRQWDDSLANEVLAKNQACLAWFDSCVERPFAFPPGQAGWDEEFPYLTAVRRLGQLECLRTARLFHDGKQKEAFELALKVTEFGHRLENSGGAGTHFLLGSAIKADGLRRLRLMTAQTSLQEAELIRFLQALDKLGANRAGLTNALKLEYQEQCKLLDDIAAGRLQSFGITNSASELTAVSNQAKRVFSADKTRAKLAQTTRALLAGIPEPFCRAEWPEYSRAKTVAKAWLQ